METTWGEIVGSTIPNKVKLYKHENSDFVRIYNLSNNIECILKYKDNLVQPRIYTDLYPSGGTCIGYQYFKREGGVDQYYRLYRFPSGMIIYEHQIHRNNKWKLITQYKFDEINLIWSKTK